MMGFDAIGRFGLPKALKQILEVPSFIRMWGRS